MVRRLARAAAATLALVFHAFFNGCHETRLDSFGNRQALHAFKDTQRLLGRIAHHKAVGALVDMPTKLG